MAQPTPIRIGTSGFSYRDWYGVFYPEKLPAAERLPFYCRHFDTLELNATYYKIPPASTFERMAERVPSGFNMIVKVNRETTHDRKENEGAMHALLEAIRPLEAAGIFGGFLAQFPWSFKNTQQNRAYLARTRELAAGRPIFVEFRNNSWVDAPLFDFLRYHDIGYVNVDEPPLEGLLPPQDLLTSGRVYIRFHGRNSANWWKGTNETRYLYEYDKPQLEEWLRRILRLVRQGVRGYTFFNNHPQGNAVKNAMTLKALLKSALEEIAGGSGNPSEG